MAKPYTLKVKMPSRKQQVFNLSTFNLAMSMFREMKRSGGTCFLFL